MSKATATATRVTLRPLEGDDAGTVVPWLAEAVAAVDGLRPGDSTPATRAAFLAWASARWPAAHCDVVCVDGAAAGFVVWHSAAGLENAGLEIDALAVRRDARNLGYGVEAVMCLEAAHPAATPYAAIPRTNGLAVYFWLRAGYRPVRLDESREMAADAERLWLVGGEGLPNPPAPFPEREGGVSSAERA